MFGAVIHAPGEVRYGERHDPVIVEPTDAVVRTVAACVCGSDLWRYRGISPVQRPTPIGHEFYGVVEAVGDAVTTVRVGDFVVGGFNPSDNIFPVCRIGAHANCQHGYEGCQADKIRIICWSWCWTAPINPGLVFDLELPLSKIAEAYAATDQRRAIKTLVRP